MPSANEVEVLDRMIGRALVDPGFRTRLLQKDEMVFLGERDLSLSTWLWLTSLPACSLQELSQAILSQMEHKDRQ